MPLTTLFSFHRRKRRYFSGSTLLMPPFFRLNAAISRVKRRMFSRSTPLAPLFLTLNAVTAAILPVKRRSFSS